MSFLLPIFLETGGRRIEVGNTRLVAGLVLLTAFGFSTYDGNLVKGEQGVIRLVVQRDTTGECADWPVVVGSFAWCVSSRFSGLRCCFVWWHAREVW